LLRLGLLTIIVIAGAIWVEPRWHADERVLTLRLRQGDEITGLIRERARDLGERAIRAAGDVPAPAPVGAGASEAPPDTPTREDRDALNRLIKRKLRESERGTSAGAN
jgi:hypothetical protein